MDLSKHINAVITIAEQAGQEILRIYDTNFSIQDKEDNSPLTAADMAAHKVIVNSLQELTPEIPILSEESAAIPFSTREKWNRYWLVDPLDGTREFIKRNGEFTVNIALIENHQPIAGVVYVPVSGVCYFASKGDGAFKTTTNEQAVRLQTRQTTKDKFVVAGSRSHGSDEQQNFFTALGDDVDIIAMGSSLKICLVAEGKVDIYPRFGPTSEWDTAAAHAVVLEAGGLVTDTSMAPLQYNTKESVLNPHFLVIADNSFAWQDYLNVNP